MVRIKINPNILVIFIVLILAVISAYFLISIQLSNMTTKLTSPKNTTVSTTTVPSTTSTTTTTIPASLSEHLLELANKNIEGKCNVTYTQIERMHLPTSRWFTDVCPKFKNYNETEQWRTSAYLSGNCNLGLENGCIEIFTSISLNEKIMCVWGINHNTTNTISFNDLNQTYC